MTVNHAVTGSSPVARAIIFIMPVYTGFFYFKNKEVNIMKSFLNFILIAIFFFLSFTLAIWILILIAEYIKVEIMIGFLIAGVFPALLFTTGKNKEQYDFIGKIQNFIKSKIK